MELLVLLAIIHFLQEQAQSMTASYAVLISLGSVILSGLVHFAVYWIREGQQRQVIRNLQDDVDSLKKDMRWLRERFAAMTGRANGESYR